MKFNELDDQSKIQSIKDSFILLLETISKEPAKLQSYIKLEKPKAIVAALERIITSMTDDEKSAIEKRNVMAEEKAKLLNEAAEKDYNNNLAALEKTSAAISQLKKKINCFCGTCIDLNIGNKGIPDELEILIDIARKEAEERVY